MQVNRHASNHVNNYMRVRICRYARTHIHVKIYIHMNARAHTRARANTRE